MVNYAGRQNYTLSEQASILWWRAVIVATRHLNRLLGWALPILLPLKPFWWIPPVAVMFGFAFGLTTAILLA